MSWRGKSERIALHHFNPLDRNSRARWRFQVKTAKTAKKIGRVDADVAEALLEHHNRTNGRCDPKHRTIASKAGCSERAVRYALARLRVAGLVDWTRRIVTTAMGALRISSAYRLMPVAESVAATWTPPARKRNVGRPPSMFRKKDPALQPMAQLGMSYGDPAAWGAGEDLLAKRRRESAAQQQGAYANRFGNFRTA